MVDFRRSKILRRGCCGKSDSDELYPLEEYRQFAILIQEREEFWEAQRQRHLYRNENGIMYDSDESGDEADDVDDDGDN